MAVIREDSGLLELAKAMDQVGAASARADFGEAELKEESESE